METVYVIKIGGNIIDSDTALQAFLRNFALVPGKKILVHGGGKLATHVASQLGIKQQMVDGRRITDAETLKVVTMVYAGFINKNIVAALQAAGVNAIGLTGADGNMILAHKRKHTEIDYGFVGDIDKINSAFIKDLLDKDVTIVAAPITHDKTGQLLNTNADTIAQELATALGKLYEVQLVYCFEKKGVLLDVNDENSVIAKIDTESYSDLKAKQLIFAGMIPKLDNAFAALGKGVSQVKIGQAEELEQLVNGTAGTSIML